MSGRMRLLGGWRLSVYWLVIAPWQFERHPNILGRPGWVLNILQPNGGYASIPARTRLGAWRRLLRNRLGSGYVLTLPPAVPGEQSDE